MKRHKQLYKHDPENGVYGDCGRTVIACLLNTVSPANVPHFWDGQGSAREQNEKAADWLESRGLRIVKWALTGTIDEVFGVMKYHNPGLTYVLLGTSPRDVGHVVICCDDAIIHDPSREGGGLVGPAPDGLWWIEVLVREIQ